MKKADSRFANHTLQLLTINTWPREWRVTSYLHEQPVFKMVITSPHLPKKVLHYRHRNVGSIRSVVKINVLQLLTSLSLLGGGVKDKWKEGRNQRFAGVDVSLSGLQLQQ